MSKPLTINSYQKLVDEWIKSVGSFYFSPATNVCLLSEEVGEVSSLISRAYGEQLFKEGEQPDCIEDAIADELADVLFVVSCIANDLEINLTEAIQNNMDKKNTRDRDRYQPYRLGTEH
jgi:NTP pyrophosphatase (non-canonical NTP hydrolase)